MDFLCEECMHYVYDDEWDSWECDMQMDEDDYGRFLESKATRCPFYCFGDEYRIVKKQM